MNNFTRHYIAMVCANQLQAYTPRQREQLLDYCEEYIAQYRKENPDRKNLPRLEYIILIAKSRLQ